MMMMMMLLLLQLINGCMGALLLNEVGQSGSALASFQGLVEEAWSQVACRGGCAAALAWTEVVVVVLLLLQQMWPILLKADVSPADPKVRHTGLLQTDEWRDLELELVVGPEQKVGSSTRG